MTDKNPKDIQKKPHYWEHRQRLRTKYQTRTAQALEDYELLEMFLFRTIPRQDVRNLARKMLSMSGGLNKLIYGDPKRFLTIKGFGQKCLDDIILLQELFLRSLRENIQKRAILGSWNDLVTYLNVALGYRSCEELWVLYLDGKNQLIKEIHMQKGTHNQTPIFPTQVVKEALSCHADGMILVHNHPTGDTKPSPADINVSKEIVKIARPLRIRLLDHVICGDGKYTSMKNDGYLT